MRMLLIVRGERAKRRFTEALAALGVTCDAAATPRELLAAMRCNRYHGVLFDVPTIVRAREFDRNLLHAVSEVYPSLRLRHDPTSDAIVALGAGVGPDCRDGLARFVDGCRNFPPRCLRRGERMDIHLPTVLWRMPPGQNGDESDGEKTSTTNISFFGCFVFTTAPWSIGERAWLEFPDVTAQPVRTRVAWLSPWGGGALPGIGLAFEAMPQTLGAHLRQLGCAPADFEVASPPKGP